MISWQTSLIHINKNLEDSIHKILNSNKILLGQVSPPKKPGVYIFYDENGVLSYIGEGKGSGGLYDRIKRKHISGDDNHVLQRTYKTRFPNREDRRTYIKKYIHVQWVETSSGNMASVLERILILLFNPKWNLR